MMTQKQLRKLRYSTILFLLTLLPILLLQRTGYTFLTTHFHEYWLFSRLPFILFPLIAYLSAKLNQNRICFISLLYLTVYTLIYTSSRTEWIALTNAISAAS